MFGIAKIAKIIISAARPFPTSLIVPPNLVQDRQARASLAYYAKD